MWLDENENASLELITNQGHLNVNLADLGIDDVILDAGGLGKQLRVSRLPEDNPHLSMDATVNIPLRDQGDNPLWICVTTEDGFQAWSSPVFAFR